MGLVKIKRNKNGDSRTADHIPTFREYFKNIDTMIKNANKRVREKLVNKRQDNSAFYASQFWVN